MKVAARLPNCLEPNQLEVAWDTTGTTERALARRPFLEFAMTNLKCIALYVVAFLATCLGHGLLGSAQQEPQSDERQEAEQLIGLLQVPGIRESDPDGVTEALRRLGRIGDERAVPVLAEYLDFERPPTDYEKVGLKLAATMAPFPARNALLRIGKSATGTVIKVIRQHGIESVGGKIAFIGCCIITTETILRNFLAYLSFSSRKPLPHPRRRPNVCAKRSLDIGK